MNEKIRSAIRDLQEAVQFGGRIEFPNEVAAELLAALPADLVAAATVEMPTEPGLYVGPSGTDGPVFRANRHGGPTLLFSTVGIGLPVTPADGPFRRLVVEGDGPRRVFTGKELQENYLRHTGTGSGAAWSAVADYVNVNTAH